MSWRGRHQAPDAARASSPIKFPSALERGDGVLDLGIIRDQVLRLVDGLFGAVAIAESEEGAAEQAEVAGVLGVDLQGLPDGVLRGAPLPHLLVRPGQLVPDEGLAGREAEGAAPAPAHLPRGPRPPRPAR